MTLKKTRKDFLIIKTVIVDRLARKFDKLITKPFVFFYIVICLTYATGWALLQLDLIDIVANPYQVWVIVFSLITLVVFLPVFSFILILGFYLGSQRN